LFEEAGKFLAGRILSETEASLQVELDSGKRIKVKVANTLLKFEKPNPAELIAAGLKLSEEIELDLAWEFAGEDEFGFADMARDYFSADGKAASTAQQVAALFRLYDAPHYFRRQGPLQEGARRNIAAGPGRHRKEKTGHRANHRLG
jgi:exoribonuclease-2